MSTIKADTLVASDGTSPATLTKQSAAKATVYIAANGASSASSLNISSIDDDGTGDRGVNLTSSMSNSTYVVLFGADDAASSSSSRQCDTTNGTMAAGTFDFECYSVNSGQERVARDAKNYVSVHGDLA